MYATLRFFGQLARDLAGTLRGRWRRFRDRVVEGRGVAAVAVDVFPFFYPLTGVGWYEWNILGRLDARDDGLDYNLYGYTFLDAGEHLPVSVPGSRRMRLRVHHLPPWPTWIRIPALRLLRAWVEPLLRCLDGNAVLFAPNFFAHHTQAPFARSVVATVHDLAFCLMPETVRPSTLAELRDNVPATLFHAERLVAVSEATRRDLVDHLGVAGRRIHTIHEGLDPAFAGGDPPPERPEGLPGRYLLFVSTLEPRKNVGGLLEAFRLLVEWGYPGSLVLAGGWGWHTGALRRALEESPVRRRIVHLDYVDRGVLPGLYRHADALLFPSWLEGFGLPLLEAMACGTAVVTSGVSAMPEVAGPAAVYVDPANPHGIASAAAALLADPGHRARLVERGLARAARFDWERAAAATAEVLRQAAGLPARDEDEYRVG